MELRASNAANTFSRRHAIRPLPPPHTWLTRLPSRCGTSSLVMLMLPSRAHLDLVPSGDAMPSTSSDFSVMICTVQHGEIVTMLHVVH